MPGLLEGYEQSWMAGVKDPSWGTEIEVRKVNWEHLRYQAGRLCLWRFLSRVETKQKQGRGRTETGNSFKTPKKAMRTWTLGGMWPEGWPGPSSWPHVLRPHCPPSVPPVCQSVLSWELWVCICSDNSSQGWFLCQQAPSLKGPFPDSTPQLLCILEP